MWEQNETESEGVLSKDVGPAIFGWFWGLGNNPELAAGMVNDGDGVASGGPDVPTASEEVDLVIGIAAAVEMECEMEIEEAGLWTWAQDITLIGRGNVPGIVGRETCGATDGLILAVEFMI